MDESTATLNLYQKLAKIRALCEVMSKNKSGYSYKYVSVDEILARISAGMKKYGVSLVPKVMFSDKNAVKVTPWSYTKKKATKSGEMYDQVINEMLVSGNIIYKWVNDENPEEYIDVPWFISGSQEDPSQAFGSAMTYALRYFLIQYFQISTLDSSDPDAWRSIQKDAENAENKEIAAQITAQIHTAVTEYIGKKPDAKDALVALIKKYAREGNKPSANYYAITDPIVASKLLEEITNFTTNNKESK